MRLCYCVCDCCVCDSVCVSMLVCIYVSVYVCVHSHVGYEMRGIKKWSKAHPLTLVTVLHPMRGCRPKLNINFKQKITHFFNFRKAYRGARDALYCIQ